MKDRTIHFTMGGQHVLDVDLGSPLAHGYEELRDGIGEQTAYDVFTAMLRTYAACRNLYRLFNLVSAYGNLNARTLYYVCPDAMRDMDKARIAKCADLVVACRETGIPVELQRL